jgi:hypothetical protein
MNDRILGANLTVSLSDGTQKNGVKLSVVNNKRVYRLSNGQKLYGVDRIIGGIIAVTPGMYAAIVRSCPLEEE